MTIKEKIQALNEEDLRIKIVMPLLKAYGCSDIHDMHGTLERGKDIIYLTIDTFRRPVRGAIVLKAEDINQSVFDTVRRQVEQAASDDYPDPVHPEVSAKVFELILMTSQKITASLQQYFGSQSGVNIPRFEVIDGDSLSEVILSLYQRYSQQVSQECPEFEIENFSDFCEQYTLKIDSERPLEENRLPLFEATATVSSEGEPV